MDRDSIQIKLKRRLFISAMMGVTNGVVCAQYGTDADMVQLGAIIKEKDVIHLKRDPRFVVPGEEEEYVGLLRTEVQTVRAALSDVVIAWNTAAGDEDSACRYARIAAEAGCDLYELNANGGYGKLIKKHIIRALILPHNRKALVDWLRLLVLASPIPVVFKFYTGMHAVDYVQLVEDIAPTGIFAVHLNVRHPTEFRPNFELVSDLRPYFDGVIFCSGRVSKREDVDLLFAAGADCVGVGRALIQDPEMITKLSRLRKPRRPSEVAPPIPLAQIEMAEPDDGEPDEGQPEEGESRESKPDESGPADRPRELDG